MDEQIEKESFLGELRNLREFALTKSFNNDKVLYEVEFWTEATNKLMITIQSLEIKK